MIEIANLEKVTGQRTAVSIAALQVADGELAALVGPPDESRSLLFQILSGRAEPSGGSLRFSHAAANPANVGILYAEDVLYERMTARQQLAFAAELRGWQGRERAERVEACLLRVGLGDVPGPISKLSPANRRRISLAMALLGEPLILLLEEPQQRADVETMQLFVRLLQEEAARGASVLVVTSEVGWAQGWAQRVFEVSDGRLLASYNPQSRKAEATAQPFKISARKDERIILYNPADILYAYSNEGRTTLRTASDEATTTLTLQELDDRLCRSGFFRAHRAYLVNLQHIREVVQFTRNSFNLVLDDEAGTSIPLSKQSAKELQELLGY